MENKKLDQVKKNELVKTLNQLKGEFQEVLSDLYPEDTKIDALKANLVRISEEEKKGTNKYVSEIELLKKEYASLQNTLKAEKENLTARLSFYTLEDKVQKLTTWVQNTHFFSLKSGKNKIFLERSTGICWYTPGENIGDEDYLMKRIRELDDNGFDIPLKEELEKVISTYDTLVQDKSIVKERPLDGFNPNLFLEKEKYYSIYYRNAPIKRQTYSNIFMGYGLNKVINKAEEQVNLIKISRKYSKAEYLKYDISNNLELFSAYLIKTLQDFGYPLPDDNFPRVADALIKKSALANKIKIIENQVGPQKKSLKKSTFELKINAFCKTDTNTAGYSKLNYLLSLKEFFTDKKLEIDEFVSEEKDTFHTWGELFCSLENFANDVNTSIKTRTQYLLQQLDLSIENISSRIMMFRKEIESLEENLLDATNLEMLAHFDSKPLPSFILITDKFSFEVEKKLNQIIYFRDNTEAIKKLIGIHNFWIQSSKEFSEIKISEFEKKCKKNSIDNSNSKEWIQNWGYERLKIEEHIQPLLTGVLNNIISIDLAESLSERLHLYFVEGLSKYYVDNCIPIYQKYAFDKNAGVLMEKFEKELEIKKILDSFQKSLEEIVFEQDSIEVRLFILRWAEDWYESQISEY